MSLSDYKVERIAFGLLLCIALLMFLAPLVRLHGPNGSHASSAPGLRPDLSEFQSNLRIIASIKYPSENLAPLTSASGEPAGAKPLAIPFSLRMASLVPWFVFAALGFCSLALLAHFFFQKAVAALSFVGGCAGAIAVLHVLLMGSDLQSWTEVIMDTVLTSASKDPSGVIRLASSFGISPGFGLYVLTASLFLVPLLSATRAVPRFRSVVRHEKRVSLSQPISLRPINSRYAEEVCTSLDVSTGGLLLKSSLSHYYVGMEVYFTRNVREGSPPNAEEHGSVVRVEKMQSGGCRIGIRIIPGA